MVHGISCFAGLAVAFIATQCFASEIVLDSVTEFEATPCWVEVDRRTDCGWLIVPENWDNPQAQKLKLPVVIYRALNPDPSLSPVVHLSGGPGFAALGPDGHYMHRWRTKADEGFPGRTLIVFDQRGVGLGSPELDCQEAEAPNVRWPLSKNPDDEVDVPARLHAAYAVCMARHLAAGRQLDAFNTRQSATDVEAMRRALKLGDIVLYGLSYGTRLALTVMKLYPLHVEAAILDSVFPPQAEYTAADAESFGAVLDRLFEACRQHERCAAAYPDLRDRLLRALAQLAEEPAIVEIANLELTDPAEREPIYARVDHRMFLEVLRKHMYWHEGLPRLPVLISGVAQGEYWRLKWPVEGTVYGRFPGYYSLGASLAVICNDDAGESDRRSNTGSAELYPYLRDYATWFDDYSFCEFWPTRLDTRNRDAVVSDIPSLLLAGGLDAATTVEQAEIAAQTLGTAHLFVFPANAHGQLRYPCAWEILNEFLANPAVRPGPACLESLRQPAFMAAGGN